MRAAGRCASCSTGRTVASSTSQLRGGSVTFCRRGRRHRSEPCACRSGAYLLGLAANAREARPRRDPAGGARRQHDVTPRFGDRARRSAAARDRPLRHLLGGRQATPPARVRACRGPREDRAQRERNNGGASRPPHARSLDHGAGSRHVGSPAPGAIAGSRANRAGHSRSRATRAREPICAPLSSAPTTRRAAGRRDPRDRTGIRHGARCGLLMQVYPKLNTSARSRA